MADDATDPDPERRPHDPDEDASFAAATLAGFRSAKPVPPLTDEEKVTLRDLMIRAADTDNAPAQARLQGFATNPLGFREFLRLAQ